MHMADALLVPVIGVGMYAASAVPTAISIKKVDLKKETEKIPLVGVMGAFVFATKMINFTIPGTGSSVLEKKNLAKIRQRIAYVFQDSQNQLFLTKVKDELSFAPDNYRYGKEKKEKKIQDAVEATGIENLLDRQVFHLSGGERKLVAIASVLTTEPSLLLMDEPSAALDPVNRRNLIQLINRLPEAKLITSHDLDMIWDTCDRVILMNKGSIAADGPVKEILSNEMLLEQNGLELPLRLQKQPFSILKVQNYQHL